MQVIPFNYFTKTDVVRLRRRLRKDIPSDIDISFVLEDNVTSNDCGAIPTYRVEGSLWMVEDLCERILTEFTNQKNLVCKISIYLYGYDIKYLTHNNGPIGLIQVGIQYLHHDGSIH